MDRRQVVVNRPFAEVISASLEQATLRPFVLQDLEELSKVFKKRSAEYVRAKQGQAVDESGFQLFTPETIKAFVDAVYIAYNSSDRTLTVKAGDLVQSIAALGRSCLARGSLPSTEVMNLLASAFLSKALERADFDKHDLHVLNSMLPVTNSTSWPDDLMDRIFVETWSHDSRFVAGKIIVSMLDNQAYLERRLGQSSCSSSISDRHQELVADILLSKASETEAGLALKSMSQFIFPGLFERQPQVVTILLDRLSHQLDSQASSVESSIAIEFWIRVAATACSSSAISPNILERAHLQTAMHHAIDDVRLACWTALTACRAHSERVELETLDLLKEWFESNMRVNNAEYVEHVRMNRRNTRLTCSVCSQLPRSFQRIIPQVY